MTRDQAKIAIQNLIDRFAEHRKAYHAADYNEAKTRQDFINPFFKALGWDVDNENGMSESYREVIYEDKVVVRGKAKAPDYGFRLMGQGKKRLFYVEAKKPSVALKANKEAAYQLRRYGSSAQAPISILTNFEDFIVYDCSKVPNLSDSASVARLKHIGFEDYIKEFDFIYDTFSHEAVTKGRFDKFVQSDANKKGNQTLDKEFVQSLDTWRKYLATSIAVNNKKINDEELNFCVQLIIDRLIFLRFCEDRGVEPYGQLQSAASKGNAYSNLFELFEQADAKYNSGLFDFEKDQLTSKLKIDNKVIKNIVEDLYYPKCRYEFSVMPVEVLGNAYEQFLGKVIRILPSRGVKIEEKPEVRKAGGVFYTPQYIVEYIVKNTVGKLVDGKTPKEIDKIKIVDPACGSGSFLVGAFEYLLHYHTDWYHRNLSDKEKKKGEIITPDGKLTTHEKKRILINNIYGVDIDVNAVEVSKLSLLLKCMEGETEASIKQQVTMFHERVLPDLDNNVKDGNSLIDTDFYEEQIDLGYEKKIKPFSWKKGFPEIFKQGGFDTVIGNPPYGADITKEQITYFAKNYSVANKFPDTYCLFMIKGKRLLKENGLFGFIVPNTFCDLENCTDFRKWFLSEITPVNFYQTGWAFKDAIVDTLVFIAENVKATADNKLAITIGSRVYYRKLQEFLLNNLTKIDYRNSSENVAILNKLKNIPPLSDFAEIKAGVKMYEKGKGTPPQNEKTIKDRPYSQEGKQPKGWLPLYRGTDVNRYSTLVANEFVNYGPWLAAPRSKDLFIGKKILMRRTDDVLRSTLDETNSICVNSCHVIKLKPTAKELVNEKYLLALLNSKLFQRIFEIQNPQMVGKIFSEIKVIYVERFPIKVIDSKNTKVVDEIVSNVDLLLKLNGELLTEKMSSKIQHIKQRIDFSEEKINNLIYGLYNLTADEIKVVEGGANE